jgi:hypothetical protein
MFIIERRTAGVLAALATTAAMAVLGNIRDWVEEVATPSTANSTAFATPDRNPVSTLVSNPASPSSTYQHLNSALLAQIVVLDDAASSWVQTGAD